MAPLGTVLSPSEARPRWAIYPIRPTISASDKPPIGHTAAEFYGDLPGTYARGDPFCSSGYYHGATAAVVTKTGADKALEEADTLCTELSEHQEYSADHRNCAHGLGHGFMVVLENELFDSLETCDALADGWEREHCYGGVFMENIMAEDNPSHPSKYLKADQPLYPCTEVEARYQNPCYQRQTAYALRTQDNDFAEVFGLCAAIEVDSRSPCYQGLGRNAAARSIRSSISDAAGIHSTGRLCALGKDYEARSNCVVGAVGAVVRYYSNDEQAEAFCESLEADLRAVCLQTVEEFYEELSVGEEGARG